MRYNSYLVDTSETTRKIYINEFNNNSPLRGHNNNNNNNCQKNIKFNQWLSGLIDGDGCFGITQKKYPNCEITVALEDEKALRQIQNKFGGYIKLRSGVKAIRYRLHNKKGIINLINAVNGNIRHTKRLVQLHNVCTLLNIDVISPIILNKNNSWFIGFFDADGTIGYYFKNNIPQLTISVTNKYLSDVQPYKNLFGGNIYFDKSQNGYYKWSIQSKKDILNFINYAKNNSASKTIKQKRLLLINNYYYLIEIKAYKASIETIKYKAWLTFNKKWNKLS